MLKRILKISAALFVVLIIAAVGVMLWAHRQVSQSLPRLDGTVRAPQLTAEVKVDRDNFGIPTIQAANRLDLAFATGFVHAQDRFFQMDLLRRNSAGELSEIVGKAALEADRKVRVNRFRDVAKRMLTAGTDEDRALIDAYTEGVNAGLASLGNKPFEYLLLRSEPREWEPEDCGLVMFSMYLDLQGGDFREEARLGLMSDTLPPGMFDFLATRGSEWDAPVQGEGFATPEVPSAEVFDTRGPKVALSQLTPPKSLRLVDQFYPGSNNWAVAGAHTTDGRALVADDMHLGIRMPNIWYRASFVWKNADGQERTMTGASLPGTPAMVVGSNGHIAWGFTNAEGDWVDVILVEVDPNDKDSYLTPDGPKKFEHNEQIIKVSGAPDDKLDVVSTIWGPVVDHDHKDRPRAIRWVAHDTEGVNMGLLRMESIDKLEDALEQANLSGSPAQNFVIADDQGRIAWTIIGRIPKRVGYDGRLPSSWADGSHRWDGYLAPAEYPRIINPEGGRIWTANARVVSGEMLSKLGDGGYDLGARAKQIRDDLMETEKATEDDMLRIQLDDRAVFLERWQQLLLDTLSSEAVADNPQRQQLRKLVDDWGGHASVNSVGFRAVREFRRKIMAQLSELLMSPCKAADEKLQVGAPKRFEGPIWRLVTEKPDHFLDPRFKSWHELLLAAADSVIADATKDKLPLTEYTWGNFNTTKIRHPLSVAVPVLSAWLDMPQQPLAGDTENMPRIQGPAVGASQRMAVSPGHEADGYFIMPGGQSGHPLSPHYQDIHASWCEGERLPFLPGEAIHTLVLKPAG